MASSIWIEEFPGAFKRHDVPPGGLTVLLVPHNSEKSDMAKAKTTKSDTKKTTKGETKKADTKAAAKGGKSAKAANGEAKKPGPKGSRLGADFHNKKIKLLVKENPRRQGSNAYRKYDLYKDGMLVSDFIKAGGGSGDIRWDLERKNIELV